MSETLMNPFWFVPIRGETARRRTLAEWGVYDELTRTRRSTTALLTGEIHARIRVVTPVHVTGEIETGGRAMARRRLYRRFEPNAERDLPVIEGSTLRGTIRSYIEALTNGAASSYLTGHEHSSGDPKKGVYAKRFRDRHVGFWVGPRPTEGLAGKDLVKAHKSTFSVHGSKRHTFGDTSGVHRCDQPAGVFMPEKLGDRSGSDLAPSGEGQEPIRVDAPTLMFGLVTLAGNSEDGKSWSPNAPVPAIAGRVFFEDAWFDEAAATWGPNSLDLDTDAILGGANPSKSNWWYFERNEIRLRRIQQHELAEFIGGQFRGRKFYFHQNPEQCLAWYLRHWKNNSRPACEVYRKIREVETESIAVGSKSELFRIRFEELPRCLVELLVLALTPSCRVRHKLGALRPFGFGSVEFEIEDVLVEKVGPASLDLSSETAYATDERLMELAKIGPAETNTDQQNRRELILADGDGSYLVDTQAWTYLRLISHLPEGRGLTASHRLFVYPAFRSDRGTQDLDRGFALPVRAENLRSIPGNQPPIRNANAQERVLDRLWKSTKRAIDLDYYQLHSDNFEQVKAEALGE